jgi:hypothetical protein
MEGLVDEKNLMDQEFQYYHVALPDHTLDKLKCQGIAVDSWDIKMDPVI